ncbi:MAG TPA: desulfoferrodoxin family protein [Bacillota bacterium]|nr:desulfoferrodoxin family protein [Bacillota bacterium]
MKEKKFSLCKNCGNLVGSIIDSGIPIVCCGQKMEELEPNTVDASQEKHVPIVSFDDCKIHVEVGAVQHPMTEEHYISFIYVQTENGGMRKKLQPGELPVADFYVTNDKPVAVYAYCNLHGLWMTSQ